MREIKFRAWNGKEMLYSDMSDLCYTSYENDFRIFVNDENSTHVMQYTGGKDANNEDIYDGDLLASWCDDKPLHKVAWDESGVRWDLGNPNDVLIVVGNIYQNPELLEKVGEQ